MPLLSENQNCPQNLYFWALKSKSLNLSNLASFAQTNHPNTSHISYRSCSNTRTTSATSLSPSSKLKNSTFQLDLVGVVQPFSAQKEGWSNFKKDQRSSINHHFAPENIRTFSKVFASRGNFSQTITSLFIHHLLLLSKKYKKTDQRRKLNKNPG